MCECSLSLSTPAPWTLTHLFACGAVLLLGVTEVLQPQVRRRPRLVSRASPVVEMLWQRGRGDLAAQRRNCSRLHSLRRYRRQPGQG